MKKDTSRNVISFRTKSKGKQKNLTYEQIVHKRRITAIVSIIVLVVLILGGQIVFAKLSEMNTNNSITTSQKKLEKEKNKNSDLKIKAKQLQDDDYIEKIIRSKYYYSKDGEQIYALPGSNNVNSNDN
ncbi:FtsB family cell division protein [Companilactobacillus sp. DQM5]|uniref:FtsB family cell division protein n=1 Tax=Companilactobacillus sp. DQM5 TaxID=3463359 RepID=UPI0040588BA4